MDSTLPMRPLLFKALIRLSRASGLHPECLPLGIIPRLGQLVAGGGFGDIYKGVISEQVVAIKIIKVYDYSDKQAVLKVHLRVLDRTLWTDGMSTGIWARGADLAAALPPQPATISRHLSRGGAALPCFPVDGKRKCYAIPQDLSKLLGTAAALVCEFLLLPST
jgi:hypothetical protein